MRSKGCTLFADGRTFYFHLDADEFAKVRDKCLMVAQRIAGVYGGSLQRGQMTGEKEPAAGNP